MSAQRGERLFWIGGLVAMAVGVVLVCGGGVIDLLLLIGVLP